MDRADESPSSDASFYAELEALAIGAALGGAQLIADQLRPTSVETKSSATDLVTDVDRAVEAQIVAQLRSRRPHDTVLGEEGGAQGKPGAASASSAVRWVIDPIDGTVNFVLGLPVFAVSVAAEIAATVVAGCVVDAGRAGTGDVFHAHLGGGSYLGVGAEARRLSGPRPVGLAHAVVGTGFSYDARVRVRQAGVLTSVLGHVANLRRLGSAALDLCYVADGRLDAYYEAGTKEWDRAAGMLVAGEAGVRVGSLDADDEAGQPGPARSAALDRCLLAARSDVFTDLAQLLSTAGADEVLVGSD